MKYTREQVEKISDMDINLAVGKIYRGRRAMMADSTEAFIPCHNWDDAMQIAKANEMSIEFLGGETGDLSIVCYQGAHSPICVKSLNVRRAICEVFLMMEIGE